jgi:hypothetical protein
MCGRCKHAASTHHTHIATTCYLLTMARRIGVTRRGAALDAHSRAEHYSQVALSSARLLALGYQSADCHTAHRFSRIGFHGNM